MRLGRILLFGLVELPLLAAAQINTDRMMLMGRNALYYEDYVLSIQRFNLVINAKPYLAEPYFFRGLAKFYLEDFTGAELDCSEAVDRNPYMANNYQLRALCRVNLKKFDLAVGDYRKAISFEPKNKSCWHNLVLCQLELKDYTAADSCLDQMIRYWPSDAEHYTIKSQVAFNRADTVQGLAYLDKALELNPYEGQAWTLRSMVSLQRGQYRQAEEEIDKAIVQLPRVTGNYINRALARYHQRNLRGAMADYDMALEIDPGNYLGHFNRGLLRAQVGDDNRAIEDFNFVLEQEPDNMIALFNRALMLDNTGDYRGAIRDISTVIDENPTFWTGYQFRASIRRKIGDVYGAERDEFKVMKAQMDQRYGGGAPRPQGKTRKRSEKNLDDYNKLVEADVNEPERTYASEYRGRVQDKAVELQPEPLYVLTYYRRESAVKRYMPFHKSLEALNATGILLQPLYLSNSEVALGDEQVKVHLASIGEWTEKIAADESDARLYLARALDYYQVRDFESAMADLDRSISLQPGNPLAWLARAQVKCRQIVVSEKSADDSENHFKPDTRLGYRAVLSDLDRVIEWAPDFSYAYYNKGNIYMLLHDYDKAVAAYSEALRLDAQFPDAWYNRGVAHLQAGRLQDGLSDLSRAGELGLYSAYNLIKRYSSPKEK